ncbi:11425_t:CDS:1, partial [Gigaspora margarita]
KLENLWNEIKIFSEEEMLFERVLEPRSFENKETNELVKKLQFELSFLIIDKSRLYDKFAHLVSELKNEDIKIKTENTKLKQDIDALKKELESKKNRKF